MVAFLIRRTFGMIVVLIAVSFVTYLIFFKIPGGDVAARIAGKQATPGNIADIRQRLGLDNNVFVQWWDMMKQLMSGQLISYYDGTNGRINLLKTVGRNVGPNFVAHGHVLMGKAGERPG